MLSSYSLPNSAAPYLSMGGYGASPGLSLVPNISDTIAGASSVTAPTGGFQMPQIGGITGVNGGAGQGISSIMTPGVAAAAGAGTDPTFMQSMLGYKDGATGDMVGGWGGPALGLGQGLLSAFMGMKQYGLAKQQLAESQRQYDQNYAAQKTTTNAALEDRQRARVASNAGAYQSVGDYMNQNGIK